jgi:hypothetical protein
MSADLVVVAMCRVRPLRDDGLRVGGDAGESGRPGGGSLEEQGRVVLERGADVFQQIGAEQVEPGRIVY